MSEAEEIPRSEWCERGDRAENLASRYHSYARKLLPMPIAGAELLDVGCGRAEFAQYARQIGWKVTVVDINPSNVAYALELGFEGRRADLNEGLPFRPNAFDGVVMVEVIEHIPKAEFLVKEIGRVLREGGWVLLTTPNHAFYKRRLRALKGREPDDEGYHFRFFVRRNLEKLFAAEGFALAAKSSFGYPPLINEITFRKTRGKPRFRFVIPPPLEALCAENFVWRLELRTKRNRLEDAPAGEGRFREGGGSEA